MRLNMWLAAVLALLSIVSSGASAQEEGAVPREARAAFEAGEAAYAAGRFEEALVYFERAYELTDEPDVLYNIATLQDRLRQDAAALASYRAYLEVVPDSEARANIEARIRVLEGSQTGGETGQETGRETGGETGRETEVIEPRPEPRPEPETRAPTPEPPVARASDSGSGVWALGGVGAGLVVAGGVLLALTAVDISTVEGASGVPWPEVRDAYGRVPVLSGIGFSALGLGVALVTAAVAWWFVAGTEESGLAIGPGGVQWHGRF